MSRPLLVACLLACAACCRSPSTHDSSRPPAPTSTSQPARSAPPPPTRRVVQVSAAANHTCVVFDDGRVRCWGAAPHRSEKPAAEETAASSNDLPLSEKVARIFSGGHHTCAVLSTGTTRCWGDNAYGELGLGLGRGAPMDSDLRLGGQAVQLALGSYHTCALLSTGHVRCWGENRSGELGYKKRDNMDRAPETAGDVPLVSEAIQLAAGAGTCAVVQGGALRCWGGQFNDGPGCVHVETSEGLGMMCGRKIGSVYFPPADVPIGGKVALVAMGRSHSCGLLDTGHVRCWGEGEYGVLGHGVSPRRWTEKLTRWPTVDIGGPVTQLALGGGHTCALLEEGRVRCWGRGAQGQLGYGNRNDIGDDETPASAGDVDLGGKVVQLSAGWSHTCALLESGRIRCWGDAGDGRLGYPGRSWVGDDETPASVGDVPLE